MADFLSEAAAVRAAPESTKGTAPSANWQEIQPDDGTLSDWGNKYTDVERNTYSKRLMLEPGDHVKKDVGFSIVHDTNKDLMDLFLPSALRCVPGHFGGTGLSLFHPTDATDGGVSDDSYTVAASGDFAAGILIYARGFSNAANNGLTVTVASTATAIKVATGSLVAETPTVPATGTIDAVGFQGGDTDIGMDASGNLTSATLDFTTLDIAVGSWLKVPTASEAGGAAFAFTNTALAGWMRVSTVAQNLITCVDHTFTPAAEAAAAGKTIRIFAASRLYRNYPLDDANYARPTLHMEKEMIDEAGAAFYEYAKGLAVNTMQIAAPINSKITTTLAFIGMDATDPVAAGSRVAGGGGAASGDSPGASFEPLATSLIDTQNDLEFIRLRDTSGTALVSQVNDWTFMADNRVSPKDVQGTFGAAGHKYGKFNYSADLKVYYDDPDSLAAVTDNTQGVFDVGMRNGEYGLVISMPNTRMRELKQELAADDIAMLSFKLVAYPERTTGIGCAISVFGYLPSA
jgi:hypothetical protein